MENIVRKEVLKEKTMNLYKNKQYQSFSLIGDCFCCHIMLRSKYGIKIAPKAKKSKKSLTLISLERRNPVKMMSFFSAESVPGGFPELLRLWREKFRVNFRLKFKLSKNRSSAETWLNEEQLATYAFSNPKLHNLFNFRYLIYVAFDLYRSAELSNYLQGTRGQRFFKYGPSPASFVYFSL